MYLVLMISNSNRGAFILKDETDQEQTSDIGMQWSLSHMVLMSIESDILC